MSTVLVRITEPNAVLPAGGFEGLEELIRRGAAGGGAAGALIPAIRVRIMRRPSDQDGGTRNGRARAAMSLDFSGGHHGGRNRYRGHIRRVRREA